MKDNIKPIWKAIRLSITEIMLFGFIVYMIHFLFSYPLVWIGIFAVFSVLLRTGLWEEMEKIWEDFQEKR